MSKYLKKNELSKLCISSRRSSWIARRESSATQPWSQKRSLYAEIATKKEEIEETLLFLLKQTSNDIRLPTAFIHCICNICAKTHSSYCVITKKIAKNDKTNLLTIYAPPTELFLLVALGNCSGETFVSW